VSHTPRPPFDGRPIPARVRRDRMLALVQERDVVRVSELDTIILDVGTTTTAIAHALAERPRP
jgi:DeoR/GlpR family transcriptional regulator of sugar metabolism